MNVKIGVNILSPDICLGQSIAYFYSLFCVFFRIFKLKENKSRWGKPQYAGVVFELSMNRKFVSVMRLIKSNQFAHICRIL